MIRRRTSAALVALIAALVLAACSAPAPVSTASATPSGASTPRPVPTASFDQSVVPDVPGGLDEESAETEAVRLADAIQALVPGGDIVYVDDHSQYVPASEQGAAYYGVIRTTTLDAAVSAGDLADSVIATLEASGWTQTQTTDQDGVALTALVSSLDQAAWFVLVGGDDSTEGAPVLTVQLASPDLP